MQAPHSLESAGIQLPFISVLSAFLTMIYLLYCTYPLLVHYLFNGLSLPLEYKLHEDRHSILFSLVFPLPLRVLVSHQALGTCFLE